jgi:hypothetical protein
VSFDFSEIFKRTCKDVDFEKWSLHDPTGELNERCFLGRRGSFSRRKPDALCTVGQKVEKDPKVDVCDCTELDFECDINFWRDDTNNCELFTFDPMQPQVCTDKYSGSTGYRKIGLSQCTGGVNLGGVKERTCDSFDHTPGQGTIFQSARFVIVVLTS